MLFLPLEEDSLLFSLCLYYGVIVLLFKCFMPLLFHCRVRIKIPHVALHVPTVPLSSREFQQRRLALQQQVAALQRSAAETPRQSLHNKRRNVASVDATEHEPIALLSPLFASPTSSLRMIELRSLRTKLNGKIEMSQPAFGSDSVYKSRSSPMAMSDFLAACTAREGGFSFHEVFKDKENSEERDVTLQNERKESKKVVKMRTRRQREPLAFSGQRPVRFVSEDADELEDMGVPLQPNEASMELETLIGIRKRQIERTTQLHVSPPSSLVSVPLSVATAPASPTEELCEHSASNESKSAACKNSLRSQDKDMVIEEDEERKESEQSGLLSPFSHHVGQNCSVEEREREKSPTTEPVTDFQAFCASFAAGRSAAARQAVAKRKHREAFGAGDKEADRSATAIYQVSGRFQHPRTLGQVMKPTDSKDTAATPHSANKRTHYEAFGSDDEQAIDNALVVCQVVEKCKHDQAFDTTTSQEQSDEKTPRIARRISFDHEIIALDNTRLKETPGRLPNAKPKCTLVIGMNDEDDKDTAWRDSLAFRPHRLKMAK